MKTTIKTKFKNAIEIHIQPLFRIYDTLAAAKACSNIHQKERDTLKKEYDELKTQRDELLEALKSILGLVVSLEMLGQFKGCEDEITDEIIKSTKAIKSNSND